MTGISAVCGSALSWREAPEPSISGMPRSATIRSRRSRRAEGQGGVAVGRLEGLVALAGQYLDHDTAVVRVVLGEQHALCHPAELLSAEVPHAEQHGAAGEYQEPVGGRDGGALLVECEAPGDVEERAARRGGAHPERPSDREAPRTRDPYPARGDHDASEIQGAADVEQPVHAEEPDAGERLAHHQVALHERERRGRCRSEERRVGKEGGSRWLTDQDKNKG